jgi:tRNA-dihydrouridine synthase B
LVGMNLKNRAFTIGKVQLDNPLLLAPLAGISNLPFRLIAKEHGAALTVTEMVSAMGLSHHGRKTMSLMASVTKERPLAVQIFGHEPESLARAAVVAVEGGADIVDFNMGCPARKVVRSGSGSALLKDFGKVNAILKAIRKAIDAPFTVKTRLGWSPGEGSVFDLVPILHDCGVDAVTIHGRYAVQGFSGQADWTAIARLVTRFDGPVIGNGDVTTPEDARKMLLETGAAGVMIGRGAMGNPWLFSRTLNLLDDLPAVPPDLSERRAVAERHARMLSDHVGPEHATRMLRSILMWYTKGLPNSAAFRRTINHTNDFDELIDRITGYFISLNDVESCEEAAA